MVKKTKTNAEYIAELTIEEIEYQIHETITELRSLDRETLSYDGAVADLRDLFTERRARKTALR